MSDSFFDINKLIPQVNSILKQKGYLFLEAKKRFNEVYLSVEGESIPSNCLPKADFAARSANSLVFIEVDKDQGVSHNIAKYFYIIDRMEPKPTSVSVIHILGPGFLASGNNYIFHRKLAGYIGDRIKEYFANNLEFSYIQSPVFSNNEDILNWLKNNLSQSTN